MLEVRDLNAYYGKSHILQGVNLDVAAGEVVSLLGRNGVGRSTTVKAIMGEVPPAGSIRFKGQDISGLPSYRIARLGLCYVPETRSIFPSLTGVPPALPATDVPAGVWATLRSTATVDRLRPWGRICCEAKRSPADRGAGGSTTCSTCSRTSKPALPRRRACCRVARSRC